MEYRCYRFNKSEVRIIQGNILESESEVIVSSDDTGISMSGGISKAILSLGGEEIQKDAQKNIPAQIGDVIVSSAGKLKQKYIFHCMSIDEKIRFDIYSGSQITTKDVNKYIISHSVEKCLYILQTLNLQTIAFPVIGTGAAHIPFNDAVDTMAETISTFLSNTRKRYTIEVFVYARSDKYKQEFDNIHLYESFASYEAMAKHYVSLQERQFRAFKADKSQSEGGNVLEKKEMNHDIFISYSRKDADTAEELCKLLDYNNIKYWIDREGIYSSFDFKDVIVKAIDTTKIVLFLSSENSNSSNNVIREIGIATECQKHIIPVLLDDAPLANSIRYDIANIDRIDYKYPEDAQNKLLASIIYRLGI